MYKSATKYSEMETTACLSSSVKDSSTKNMPLVQESDSETSPEKDLEMSNDVIQLCGESTSGTPIECGVMEKTVSLNSSVNESSIKNRPPVQENDSEMYPEDDLDEILLKRNSEESNNLAAKHPKIKIFQQQPNRRYKQKLENVKTLFNALKKKRFMDNDSLDIIQRNTSPKIAVLIQRQDLKSGKKPLPHAYLPELRTFALTLHYYSPQAYEYVRETFDTCLPHSRTLGEWYQKVNASPGFTKESLNALSDLVKNNDNLLFALTFNEMQIRKSVESDGYIDMGTELLDDDSLPLVKDALVFVVVAINAHFKVPVGYFLVDGIPAPQKANLILQCLSQLHSVGARVVSITFHEWTLNVGIATHLGCDFSPYNLKTSFKHPDTGQDVVVFLDPAYMLRLVQLALQSNGSMKDGDNNIIDWKFIEEFSPVQDDEDFNFGNELRTARILHCEQEMNVRVVAQTLSRSLADPVKFYSEVLRIEAFQESGATVKFLKTFNDLLDILNSQSKKQEGYKKPISEENFDAVNDRLTEVQNYICTLKTRKKSCKLINSDSITKTGFVGFLICIESLRKLYDLLIKTQNELKYIPMYKFSQDPLDLFFQCVRSQVGGGDDPTAREFKAAYKKLITNSEINRTNTLPLQSIDMLTVSSETDPKDVINSTTERNQLILNMPNATYSSLDHDYILHPRSTSKFPEHVIYYVAGLTVCRLSNNIKCDICIKALFSAEPRITLTLVSYESGGSLIDPSDDVHSICKAAESEFRRNITADPQFVYQRNALLKTEVKTLHLLLNTSSFTRLESHSFDQEPLQNHVTHLMRAVVKQYLNIRFRYYRKHTVRKFDFFRY